LHGRGSRFSPDIARRRRRVVAGASIIVLAILAASAPPQPSLVEDWFSTRLYPAIQAAVTPLSNRIPVALLDVLIVAAVAAVALFLVRTVRAVRRTRRLRPVLAALGRFSVAAAAVYLAFLLLWGLNYRRLPMEERLSLLPSSPSPEAVVELGITAANRLNALHEMAHRSGWQEDPRRSAPLLRAFEDTQRALSEGGPARPGRLKRSMLGPYFRWTSVDGMINPFGLEVLVNPDLLPFEVPFIAAHEWAHLAGYADESEASFVGLLTCLRGDAAAQYSGWLALYWQVNAEVSQAERAQLARTLAAGPRADIDAVVARIRRGEQPWLRDAGWRAYDQYLKANRVEEGVRSYGKVLTLFLRARLGDDWTPVRAGATPTPQ
jgi:hypothetical protein